MNCANSILLKSLVEYLAADVLLLNVSVSMSLNIANAFVKKKKKKKPSVDKSSVSLFSFLLFQEKLKEKSLALIWALAAVLPEQCCREAKAFSVLPPP